MWSLICLQLLLAATGHVDGIELSLTAVHDADICGKVRCIDTASNGDSIKNLTIRKQLHTDVVLVEMSQQQPSFTSTKDDRTTKGFLAKGSLSSHRAEVQISLYNTDDCKYAEFICEIVHANKLGVERVRSSSGRINGKLGPHNFLIQELLSYIADLENKLKRLTKTDSNILSRLLPTTCSTGTSPPQYKRYQVVYPTDGTPSYLCDTDGGWTVIQHRIDGKTDFYRNWSSYKDGFGSFGGDFWLGLERIHQITSSSNQELNITMKYKGKYYHAHYDNFRVSGEEDNYRLSIGAYTGTAGDELRRNNNTPFTTYDKDNDGYDAGNCAQYMYKQGAWWYDYCVSPNLNGKWGAGNYRGLEWYALTKSHSVTMSEMKIRKMV